MEFTARNDIVMHQSFQVALNKLERTHQKSKVLNHVEGLMITAPSGAGKTTLIKYFEKKFPRIEEIERTTIPILVVETPSAPTAKSLVETIQIALSGYGVKGTTEFQTQRVYTLLKQLKVELLIIDEFQHFVDRKRANDISRVTDWLKSFLNSANIPVVIFGLPRSLEILELNEQLRRRFSAQYFMHPFGFTEPEQQKEFRAVLKGIEIGLPFRTAQPIHEYSLARRFHYATNGLFDYLIKIVDGAVEVAQEKLATQIDQAIFESAFRDKVWSDVPDELNPFSPKFTFRRLDKAGEPFAAPGIESVSRGASSI